MSEEMTIRIEPLPNDHMQIDMEGEISSWNLIIAALRVAERTCAITGLPGAVFAELLRVAINEGEDAMATTMREKLGWEGGARDE